MISVGVGQQPGFQAFTKPLVLTVLIFFLAGPTLVNATSNKTAALGMVAESSDGNIAKALAVIPISETGTNLSRGGSKEQKADGEKSTYIVVLKDEPLARYSGGVAGYAGTSLQSTGAVSGKSKGPGGIKLNARSPQSVSYLSYLAGQRSSAIESASTLVGRDLDVSYEYGATIVGFAAEMTAEEAKHVAGLAQVAFVELEKLSYPHTDAGPVWSGAAGVWGGGPGALSYEATLSGDSEAPAVTSTVSGTGEFTYDFDTNVLSYTVEVENPSGINLTTMHIHQAPAGANGPVIHNLNLTATVTGFMEMGSVILLDVEETALVNGGLYVNVHSDVNPGGEVRGQIVLNGTLGEGIIVGVIDTGIDPWNPSFLETGGDGYAHTNPFGAATYVGVCDPLAPEYDATFPCNEKLIGAWGYPSLGSDPRDSDGHGSHTASTAAGNFVFGAVIDAPTEVFTADISGVAPHANIIAYAACCTGSALAAARDQALLDGVDVINYSIGSSAPTGNPWGDSESLQWLALHDAGIFVATSNGNSGNGDATTGSPSDLPWLTAVGANSHDRAFLTTLVLTDSNSDSITVAGQAMSSGFGPAEVVFSNAVTDTTDTRLCAPGVFPPGTFSGEIVICERGIYSRVAKGQSVLDGGASGFVLAQPEESTGGPGSVAADTHVLPAIHIDYYQYQALRQFLLVDAVGTVNGVLSGASLDYDNAHGDIMASFSSRGPNGTDADLIVPSVTAPGRAIWAAYHQGDAGDGDFTYNVIQGTSMSSPHVAGAAALLTVLHPDWTPAEMQSALMMTARDTVLDDDAMTVATPFAQGAGHINALMAAESPLLMNVTTAEFHAADPTVVNGFDIRDLNIASLGENECVGTCRWTRTVENVSADSLTWTSSFDGPVGLVATVTPAGFTLAPGATQQIEVEIDVTALTIDGKWHFATLDFDETSGNHPDAHWPVAVIASAGNLPSSVEIVTQTTAGSVDLVDLVTRDITDFHTEVTGLITADRDEFTLVQDNNLGVGFPDIFFDDPATTHFVPIVVPADSFSVIAEIMDTASPDLDILLFRDLTGDGPDVTDAVGNPDYCQSATGGSAEACEIFSPTAGTYYVAILNFSQLTPGGDRVDLATGVIPDSGTDEGNLTISGPMTVSGNTPYAITVNYNEPAMSAIDRLYGYFTVGTDPDNAGNVGTVRVNLKYLGTPDISITPATLAATLPEGANVMQTLTLSATGGVLDWNVDSPSGTEAVQDGGFEAGYATNPYWRGGASQFSTQLPICSPVTCGAVFASEGNWYLWMGGTANLTAYAEQDISIASGDVANLTFQMLMGTAEPATAIGTLTVSMDGTTIAIFTEADLASFGSYTTVNLDVTAYADGASHLLRFDFENPGVDNFNMIIDQVSVLSDFSASSCNGVGSISWLSVNPSSGSMSPGQIDLGVTFDAAGLAPAIYTDKLCVTSNDPDEPVLYVPVALTVEADRILDVSLAGSGSGSVVSTPAGIDCGADCSEGYSYLTDVALAATASAGSIFIGWSGDPDCTDGNVSMGTDVSCIATFNLEALPVFSKAFMPDTVVEGVASTLIFTLDNSANPIPATAVGFADIFPAGLSIASPANAASTCTGGTLTAVAGTSSVSYAGGQIPVSSSCMIWVDVVSVVPAAYTNTSGDLTSGFGNSGPASDTLTVTPIAPGFNIAFDRPSMYPNETAQLVFTIDNGASGAAATGLAFINNLPAGMSVAAEPPVAVTCTGGTITAVVGGNSIEYTGGTVGAGALCRISVPVTAGQGTYVNTSGNLSSSSGVSAPGSAEIRLLVRLTVAIPTLSTMGLLVMITLFGWSALRPTRKSRR